MVLGGAAKTVHVVLQSNTAKIVRVRMAKALPGSREIDENFRVVLPPPFKESRRSQSRERNF
jgi:hypothetical protein